MGYLDNTGLAYLWGKIKAKLVQPDWQQNDETAADYVKNRPGGFDILDVNITWDGVVGDKVTVENSDGTKLVHVSDEILMVDQINGSTLRASNGYEYIISDITDSNSILANITLWEGEPTASISAAFVSTPGWTFQGNGMQLTFPEAGVYFVSAGPELYVASMTQTIPITIPQRYLSLYGYVQEVYAILTTPQVHTLEEKQQARANIGLIPVAKTDAMTQSVGLDAYTGKLWTVPPTGDNIVLASSTTGSTKKFRIVVDDSGTLSAVEVTDAS